MLDIVWPYLKDQTETVKLLPVSLNEENKKINGLRNAKIYLECFS